ncbi:MAG: DUF4406 domain-containing protein [Acidimicrobiales bacterium]
MTHGRIYIAGPMRGVDDWNFPAFDAARDLLVAAGWEVVSPADLDRTDGIAETTRVLPPGFERAALRRDVAAIATCGAIAFLPGFERSEGAILERRVGRAFGCRFYRVDPDAGVVVPELVVGLAGYARSGKDTAAAALVELGFERRAFADAIREMACRTNPLVRVSWWRRPVRLARLVDRVGWEDAKDVAEVRRLLQRLGGHAGRGVLGDGVFIDWLAGSAPCRMVVPGVRFPNEIEAVRAGGGIVIQIVRPGVGPVNRDVSETAVDGAAFDAVVVNDASPEVLGATVREAVVALLGEEVLTGAPDRPWDRAADPRVGVGPGGAW